VGSCTASSSAASFTASYPGDSNVSPCSATAVPAATSTQAVVIARPALSVTADAAAGTVSLSLSPVATTPAPTVAGATTAPPTSSPLSPDFSLKFTLLSASELDPAGVVQQSCGAPSSFVVWLWTPLSLSC
jgi:hypothetical protein